MKIALLTTGGTIASQPTARGLAPAMDAQALLERASGVRDMAEIVVENVFSLDSSNIQPEEWCVLARAADRALRYADGVVITHGTDTMAYSAAALSYMLSGQVKPVIFTGSQLPIAHPLSDAPANLAEAFLAATSGVSGVYIAFNRKLIHGARAVKLRTTSFDAFDTVNAPLSGVFDADGLHWIAPQARNGAYRLLDGVDERVFLLKLVPGTSPDVFDYILQAGYRGVVIEAFGLGGIHYIRRNLVEKLRELEAHGVICLVTTQCLYERADFSVYEVGRNILSEHVFSGRDMTTEAAVAKLMWMLGDWEARGRFAQESVCGEI